MFSKLFGRNRNASHRIEIKVPDAESEPVAPVTSTATKAEDARSAPRLNMEERNYSSVGAMSHVGKLFPRAPSIISRKVVKRYETLHMDERSNAAGLGKALYALAAQPIRKGEDAQKQWAGRLRELKALAKHVERGTLPGTAGATSLVIDREAAEALDRLLTLNKGSGEKQQLHRVEQFFKAARADAKVYGDFGKIETAIAKLAKAFGDGMAHRRNYLDSKRTSPLSEALVPEPAAGIEHAGIYAELDQILKDSKGSKAILQRSQALYDRVANDESFTFNGSHELPRPAFLNFQVRSLLGQVLGEYLKPSQQVTLLRDLVEQLRPAAQEASRLGEFDLKIQANSTKPAVANGPYSDTAERFAAQHSEHAELREQMRQERIEQSRSKRWARSAKLGLLGLIGVGSVGGGTYYGLSQQQARQAAFSNAVPEPAPFDGYAYARQLSGEADAGFLQSERNRSRSPESFDELPTRPYRDEYRAPKLPPYDPYAGMSAEDRDYHQCLDRNVDPATDMLIYGHGCVSPELKRMDDEADAKYGSSRKPVENISVESAPVENIPAVSPPVEDLTVPSIDEAPAYTEEHVRLMNEAFPKLAAGSTRTAEPMNVNVNFDIKR